MREIPLTQGKIALVDDTDYESLSCFKWFVKQDRHIFYAAHKVRVAKCKEITERMHRLILGLQPGDKRQCDHRDGDGLNNQRDNLRICTKTQNGQARTKWKVGTSRYKGICWNAHDCKWRSVIKVNKRSIWLGYFDSERNAALAYDLAALEHHGTFARTNKMLGLL